MAQVLLFYEYYHIIYVDNIYLNWAPDGTDVVNKWDGSKSTNWNDFQNWDAGVPSSSENISIVDTDNDPISSSNITVDSGSTLTIAAGSSLTVGGDFSNNGTTTLNSTSTSYSSLKVSGSSSGNITYNRYVNEVAVESEWDLVGSPVGSQSISAADIVDMPTDNNAQQTPSRVRTGTAPHSGNEGNDFTSARMVWNALLFNHKTVSI